MNSEHRLCGRMQKCKHYLLSFGMIYRPAILFYVLLICLGSLGHVLNIAGKVGVNRGEPRRMQHRQGARE
jgi:hypothetical protein